jgi:hypothetical protein
MAIEIINGFKCKTCTDVDYAKKHIDPAHPKDGPYGVNKPEEPLVTARKEKRSPVEFAGALSALNGVIEPTRDARQRVPEPGARADRSI